MRRSDKTIQKRTISGRFVRILPQQTTVDGFVFLLIGCDTERYLLAWQANLIGAEEAFREQTKRNNYSVLRMTSLYRHFSIDIVFHGFPNKNDLFTPSIHKRDKRVIINPFESLGFFGTDPINRFKKSIPHKHKTADVTMGIPDTTRIFDFPIGGTLDPRSRNAFTATIGKFPSFCLSVMRPCNWPSPFFLI